MTYTKVETMVRQRKPKMCSGSCAATECIHTQPHSPKLRPTCHVNMADVQATLARIVCLITSFGFGPQHVA